MEAALRCFSCGSVLKWNRYARHLQANNHNRADALNKMEVKRFCCRRMYITTLNVSEQQIGLRQTLEETKLRVIESQSEEKKEIKKEYKSWFVS